MLDDNGEILRCPTCNKRCYSGKEADELLSSIRRYHRSNRHSKIPKRKYLCPDCQYYHLTAMAFSRESKRKDGRKKVRYIKTV